MSLPIFTDKICSHRGACLACRNVDKGGEWRAAMQAAFQMPLGWQHCPIGIPWNATAADVEASRGKVFAGPSEPVERPAPIPAAGGVGTEVKKLLAGWGIKACNECSDMARQWDAYGIEECERRVDELVATLVERAKKRGWALGLGAKLAARPLVLKAIENAKANRPEST